MIMMIMDDHGNINRTISIWVWHYDYTINDVSMNQSQCLCDSDSVIFTHYVLFSQLPALMIELYTSLHGVGNINKSHSRLSQPVECWVTLSHWLEQRVAVLRWPVTSGISSIPNSMVGSMPYEWYTHLDSLTDWFSDWVSHCWLRVTVREWEGLPDRNFEKSVS